MNISNDSTTQRLNDSTTQRLNDSTTQRLNDSLLTTSLALLSFFLLSSLLLSCTGSVSSDPTTPPSKIINASMAWVSMREGLVQFDNGTQGVTTIGVIVSKSATAPAYTNVKDFPGFYTRKTKIDGTPRTVYLSMTDKMTTNKFNADITVSIDGGATGFISAIVATPEILHPNTSYYAHFYEIAGTTGTAIEKLEFTTENFPATFPTNRGTYSSFYNQISTASTFPAIEYKASERSLIPFRYHYLYTPGGPYVFSIGNNTYEFSESSKLTRPFNNSRPLGLLFYDLYNITPSGPSTHVELWDGMVKQNIGSFTRLSSNLGDQPTGTYSKKIVLVTE